MTEFAKIIPVKYDGRSPYFVDSKYGLDEAIEVAGQPVVTAPLQLNTRFTLLGISTTESALEQGLIDPTDCVYPNVYPSHLYMTFGEDVLAFEFPKPPEREAIASRRLRLETAGDFEITAETKPANGKPLTTLKEVLNEALSIRLSILLFTEVNFETADTFTSADAVKADLNITQSQREALGSKLDDLVAIVQSGRVIGYKLHAERINYNRQPR